MPNGSFRRVLAASMALIIALTLGLVSTGGTAVAAAPPKASVILDWERTLLRTVYAENATPIPVGVLYLGFTSLAMYRAVQQADERHGSEAAAAAVAAHDVLLNYFPASKNNLDADLAASLRSVHSGWAKQRGIDVGHRTARALIADRLDDGRNDTGIVYRKSPGVGVWQPPPDVVFLSAWIAFVDPLVIRKPASRGGPDPITGRRYAAEYDEVKKLGSVTSTTRTPRQTATALFFNSNSASMVGEGLIKHLEQHPLGLEKTAKLFAMMHVSMTDSIISCWRLKFDLGFWRPFQAIQGAGGDGNRATVPDPNWAPLIPNPPYPDYVSGHGCLTAPAAQVIRRTLGERTSLTLFSIPLSQSRTYPDLHSIERDAHNSRIWGGLHFRDAMDDAYAIGHKVADTVVWRFDRDD